MPNVLQAKDYDYSVNNKLQKKATRRSAFPEASLPRGEGGFFAKGEKDERGIIRQPGGQPPSDEGGVTAGDGGREILFH